MSVIKARGEFVDANESINLTVQFKDANGNPVNTNPYPSISIISPTGLVILPPTTAGVSQIDVGKYSYIYSVGYNPTFGVYNDVWTGIIDGYKYEANFNFICSYTQLPGINSDGYVRLGDDPGFHYSQQAIININKLIKLLKRRLNSAGKVKTTDKYGNTIYVDCDIFSVDQLVTFLAGALWDFNQVPYFTFYQFDDDMFIDQFGEVLVEGATLYALASRALIEKGNEINVSDNGINFTLPTVSDMLNTQYSTLLTNYWDKLKYIKNSLRPQPKGLGIWSMSSGANPAVRRLRHLKEKKLI